MGVSRNEAEQVKMVMATGAASATKISVTGMGLADTVTGVIDLTTPAAISLAGLTMVAGGFKITASTADKNLAVLWVDKSEG
jgi:hypothetical protein